MQSWQPLRLLPWLSLCPAMWPQLSLSQAMQTDHLLLLGLQDLPAHLEAFFAAVVSGHRQIEKMKLGIRGGQTSSTPGRWTWIANAWHLCFSGLCVLLLWILFEASLAKAAACSNCMCRDESAGAAALFPRRLRVVVHHLTHHQMRCQTIPESLCKVQMDVTARDSDSRTARKPNSRREPQCSVYPGDQSHGLDDRERHKSALVTAFTSSSDRPKADAPARTKDVTRQ